MTIFDHYLEKTKNALNHPSEVTDLDVINYLKSQNKPGSKKEEQPQAETQDPKEGDEITYTDEKRYRFTNGSWLPVTTEEPA